MAKLELGLPGVHVDPGDHICAFYWGRTERDHLISAFVRAGLRGGDKCLCLVDADDPAWVLDNLRDGGDIDAPVEARQLEVSRAIDAYLRDGRFTTEGMIAFLEETMAEAMSDGRFDHVRAVGEMSWVLDRPPDLGELIRYESAINRFSPRYPQVLLCMYDLERFGGGMVLDLLRTHPRLLMGGMVLDNPHYLSPDEFEASR
jgi:hypothetical protein